MCGTFNDLDKRNPEFATLPLKALMAARQSKWELGNLNDGVDSVASSAFYKAGGYTGASWQNGCPALAATQNKEEIC
jgi:hypothetical protein